MSANKSYELVVDNNIPDVFSKSVSGFINWHAGFLRLGRKIKVILATERMRYVGEEECASLFRVSNKKNDTPTIKIFIRDTFLSVKSRSEEEMAADILADLARNMLNVVSLIMGFDWNKRFIRSAAHVLVLMYIDDHNGHLYSGSSVQFIPHIAISCNERITFLIDLNCPLATRKILQKQSERDHVWCVRMAETYQIEKSYVKADSLYRKALAESSRCPFALWNYSSCLVDSGRIEDALDVLLRLSKIPLYEVAHGVCGEGLRRARKLENDARYLQALCLNRIGKKVESRRMFKVFLKHRHNRIGSVYSQKEINRFTQLLEGPI